MSGEALLPQRTDRRWLLQYRSLLAIAAATAGILTIILMRRPTASLVSLASLASPSGRSTRRIEPRVSGLEWAPFKSVRHTPEKEKGTRGEEAAVPDQNWRGRIELLAGAPDRALTTLKEASASSNAPAAWSDLSAAYYETAFRHDAPELLADALAAVDHALAIDSDYPEALFNRALIIEHLGFKDDAGAAWMRYLAVDGATAWADEARSHRAALARESPFIDLLDRQYDRVENDPAVAASLTAHDPFGARGMAVKFVLGRWGAAVVRGDEHDAERHLRVARQLAVPVTRNGDTFLAQAITAIDAASGARRSQLAAAHSLYLDGLNAFDRGELIEAEAMLRRAAKSFESTGSPMRLPALLFAANTLIDQGQPNEAQRQHEELLAGASSEFVAYRAIILWHLGLSHAAKGEWGKAISYYEESHSLFESIHETGNAAIQSELLAIVYDRMGDPAAAWQHRVAARDSLGTRADMVREKTVASIADAAIVSGAWERAASFLTLDIDMAGRAHDDVRLANALFLRAIVRDRLRHAAGSRADFAAAKLAAGRVSDPAHRAFLTIAQRRAEAMFAATTPARAVALLTEAIDFEPTRGDRNLPGLLLQRARAHREARDPAGAMADVKRGIAELERQRESLPEGEARWGAFHAADALFDVGIELSLEARQVDEAFAFAESARARALLDSYRRSPILDYRRLPPRSVVVEYVAMPSRLTIFTASASGVRATTVDCPRSELAHEVDAFTRSLRSGAMGDTATASAALHRHLIAPIAQELRGATTIAFVTDAATSMVAFSALQDGAGTDLLADHALVVAPSAAAFVAASERRGQSNGRPGKALLIAAPQATEDAPSLVFVERESRLIAAAYPSADRISQDADQFEELSRRVVDADIVHFGGHAVGDDRGFNPASIVLRKNGHERRVRAAEIAKLRFGKSSTIVLAGCGTARGERRAAEGVISVAYGFLSAGAPSVIATLWPISDEASAVFFPRLHQYLAKGLPPREALREAQLESIRRGDVPASLWAAVQDIGN